MRTRYWESEGVSTTAVQFRDDTEPMVHIHTNMGWVAVGNAPKDVVGAEKFAEDIARGYHLTETTEEQALYMAGGD